MAVNDAYDLDTKNAHLLILVTYTQFVKHKQERLQAEWKHYDQLPKKIAKLEDFVNRNIVRAFNDQNVPRRGESN